MTINLMQVAIHSKEPKCVSYLRQTPVPGGVLPQNPPFCAHSLQLGLI